MNNHLPESLLHRLRHLAWDIRLASVLRTVAVVWIGAVAAFGVALAAERAFGLTVPLLRALNGIFAAILIAGMSTVGARLFARSPSTTRLARLVEIRHPAFDERLLTLASMPDDAPRSPLLDALAHETTEAAANRDFRLAFSWRSTWRLARIAAAMVVVVGLVVALWPDASRFARRVALAWTPAVYGFEIHASPAGGFSPLGQPLLLAADLIPLDSHPRLPDRCVVIVQSDNGPPRRLAMTSLASGRFAVAIAEMPAKLTFVVEAGERTSGPIEIFGAPPVASVPIGTVTEPAPKQDIAAEPDASVAPQRVEQSDAENLALQEESLAKEIAQSAKDDPEDLARWAKQQAAIVQAFEKWAADHPLLKEPAAFAQMRTAEQLARKADRLAEMQHKFTDKIAKNRDERLTSELAAVATKQDKLAGEIARLQRDLDHDLDSPAIPVPVAQAKDAGQQLAAGKIELGLAQQLKTIAGLEKVREKLATFVVGNDPRKLAGKLADAQQKLIDDLEKLGDDFPRIPEAEMVKRLQDIHQRQKSLHKAIGELSVPPKEKKADALRREAADAADEAVQNIRKKDILPARDSMEKARDALRRLNQELAASSTDDASARDEQREKSRKTLQATAEELDREQKRIRDETRKLASDAFKDDAKTERETLAKAIDQLNDEATKLAQEMAEPDGKSMANEAADDIAESGKAMASAQDNLDRGSAESAGQDEQKAGLKLQSAGRKLGKLAAGAPKTGLPTSDLIGAFQEAKTLLNRAGDQPAPDALNRAAEAMRKTAQLAGNQRPGTSVAIGNPNASPPEVLSLPIPIGAAWGDLPGEVRTRLTQDWRARYGTEYEEIIRRYFRNLSSTPTKK